MWVKYETIYKNLIEKRLVETPEGYSEEHHITPKSLGGSDSKDNLVRLTAREHYLAHYLLMKMQKPKSDGYYSMVKAFLMMQVQHESGLRYIPGHKFELLRKINSEQCKGSGNSSFGTMWICNPDTGEQKKIKRIDILPEGFYSGKGKVRKICPICGNDFVNYPRYKTCSIGCRSSLSTKSRYGEDNKSSKLTRAIVDGIRDGSNGKGMPTTEIGDMFGVSNVTIHYIKTYKLWK